jgi:hypothetical protein
MENLHDEMEQFVGDVLNSVVVITETEICLPKMLSTYIDQFGNSEQAILEFVFRYLDDP